MAAARLSPSSSVAPRVRFAPSPTGMLHVGNARTALYNCLFARQGGGAFVLRIEDTDVERSEERHETQLMEDLLWLGLGWTEGPMVGGPHAPYRQSERLGIYNEHTARLLAGGHAYRCFCAPGEHEEGAHREHAVGGATGCAGGCAALEAGESERRAQAGESFAVRLRIPAHPLRFHDLVRGAVEFPPGSVMDPVIVRSGTAAAPGMPVYNFVVVVDDALMGITHVIRGDDHISNTPRQVALYEAFGYPVPEFAHLSTILGADRERLSKRHGATSIASFREMGILPEALVNYLALLGWGPEGGTRETFTFPELVAEFRLDRVTPSPAVFDWAKLEWLNRHYLKGLDPVRLRELAWEHLAKAGLVPAREGASPELVAWVESLAALLVSTVDRLEELPAKAEPVFARHLEAAWTQGENEVLLRSELSRRVLEAFWARLKTYDLPLTAEDFKRWMGAVKDETGAKGKDLFHPVRVVLTGAHSGPEFDKLVPVIERGSRLAGEVSVPSVRERFQAFQLLLEQV